ncbi:MAG: hypothetical protein V1904_14425 [Bacteroidota bacterium]
MKNIKRIIPAVLLLLIFSYHAEAQYVRSLNIGWTYGHMFKPLSNLEIPLYQFNQLNPDIEKPYDMPEFFRGLYIDWRIGGPRSGMILGWNNKHVVARAKGIATGSGETEYNLRNVKARLNTFSFGFYFSLYKRLKMGITFDIGSFKVKKKIGPESSFNNASWEKMYDTKGNIVEGLTVNISYPLKITERIALRIQPYAQGLLFYKYPTLTDTYTNTYYYQISNFGVNAFISFMKMK